jgi:hypothetical protein
VKHLVAVCCMVLSALLPAYPYAQQTINIAAVEEFQKFWSEFRTAALVNDKAKIASMAQFPFRTRGTDDSDPIMKHNKKAFFRIWDRLLAQDPGLSPEPDTTRRLLERKTSITSQDVTISGKRSSARVGNLVFTKVQGKWLFTFAYLDEPMGS